MAQALDDLRARPGREVPPLPCLEGSRDVPEDVFLRVLDEAVSVLEAAGIRYAALGGLASSVLGRYRWTHDIDLFVRPEDADPAVEALREAGFTIQRTNPYWLYKGVKDDVLVDILFRAKGDLSYDEEMMARTRDEEFKGRRVRVLAPEDLLVIKVVVHDEETPRHWFDALGLLKGGEIDWDYLERRARVSPRRVLSLLIYAQSEDHMVPDRAVRNLFEAVMGEEGEP